MKPALLVIDVQKQFFEEDAATADSLKGAVWHINQAVKLFRAKKLPVVYVQHIDEASGPLPGTPGFELPDSFDVQPEDIRISKTYNNAFNKTGLADKLKALDVDTLIITGYCAEWCILSTTRGAWDLDYKAILLQGSIASGSAEAVRFVEGVSDTISLGALKAFLPAI
jgi:nicotinamidase-related amidase